MIPLHLKITGFLSYRRSAELDFTGFDLACISGPNGAGKSTLLDAMTWALFGQARRRDEALINLQSDAAEVIFTFRYENADYRILRTLRRGKPGSLELQVSAPSNGGTPDSAAPVWKPLTERSQRETQARIEQILRLDYETFINASFFLQGKADSFTQQAPAARKEILGSILGMEIWETYKSLTAERRRSSEAELGAAMARLAEVSAELVEEPQRRQRLTELEEGLKRLRSARQAQGAALEGMRQSQALLESQRKLLGEQTSALDGQRRDADALQLRLQDRQAARDEYVALTGNAPQIELDYAAWRTATLDLERWEGIAREFRNHEVQRGPMLQAIASERARLEQERTQLEAHQLVATEAEQTISVLAREQDLAQTALAQTESQLLERKDLAAAFGTAQVDLATRTADNKNLKEKMDDLKRRIDTLDAATGVVCPLCGQDLTDEHRRRTVDRLQAEGRELGDRYRSNTSRMNALRDSTADLKTRLDQHPTRDDDHISRTREVAALAERMDALRRGLADWSSNGSNRLRTVAAALTAEDFAVAARTSLATVDAQLAALGYDAAAHDEVRRSQGALRLAEGAHARLQSARGALDPLENEISSLQKQIKQRAQALDGLAAQVDAARLAFEQLEAATPDVAKAERDLFELQEQENALSQEVGAARQKVAILSELKARNSELQATRESLAVVIGRHKMLESAFGKDGVPALLIEQALPELEAHANDILDRLSDGRMSVHFETQTAYRDRKRDDLRETLEIKISDGAGKRAYEMYSGGEAFRVNFAIRLALSQVLAGRTGARLQTLVIDEGFGSQDAQGIQRLIETINVIRPDFAKILLISHLDELKDAFATRIEVEKTEDGSVLSVN